MKRLYALTTIALFLFPAISHSQITLTQFASGFNLPVDIKNCGDDRLFIVELDGIIKIVDTNGVTNSQPFLNITSRVNSGGERGLLGLAFDPNYATNGFFYVYYTENSHGDIVVSRFSVSDTDPDLADPASEDTVIRIWHPYSNHNGGHIAFRKSDGYLYIGTGDGGSGNDPQNRAQNPDSLLGKILRIDVSDTSVAYKIPPDNPLVASGAGRGEVWNIGMRNPWRWSFDSKTNDLWMGDVGQNAWEEIDFQPVSQIGGNYGWRCYEGDGHNTIHTVGDSCAPPSTFDEPIYEYSNTGAAVVGGYVYRGAKYSNLYRKYFLTDQYTTTYQFRTLEPNGTGGWTASLLGTFGRTSVVTFGEDKWGEIYCSDYNNGGIYRFEGAPCSPVASISDNDTIYLCDTTVAQVISTAAGNGFHYEWFHDGAAIPASDNDSLFVNQTGTYYVTVTDPNACTATSDSVYLISPLVPTVQVNGLDTFYCVYNDPDTLSGTPAGGTFSGTGLTGANNNIFDPAVAGTGIHTISYSYYVGFSECTYTYQQDVHVDLCSSTPEQAIQRFRVYPNPSFGMFTLNYYIENGRSAEVEVYDITGRIVYIESLHAEKGIQSSTINLTHLSKGIYNLKLSAEKNVFTKRIVIE